MRSIICPGFCRYYNPDKPDPEGCGGLNWIAGQPGLENEVAQLQPDLKGHLYGIPQDHPLLMGICADCAFRIDGCDFRDPEVPDEDCEPCGGLRVVAALLSQGHDLGANP
jgi:hypothetical protein